MATSEPLEINELNTSKQSTKGISEAVKNSSGSMSRKTEEGEAITVRGSHELQEQVNKVEKRHQTDEEEKEGLLVVEDVPIPVQLISAACQSTSSQRQDKEECRTSWKGEKKNISIAFLTLILVLFNLSWSVGLSYWNFQLNNFNIAVTTLVIIVVSGSITSVSFFCVRASPSCTARNNLWRCSKVAWLLSAIPCLVPVTLAAVYFIFSVLDKGSGELSSSNSAPGSNESRHCAKSNATTSAAASRLREGSGSFYLIESLALCLPMCVLHLCVLMEDPNSVDSFMGLYTLLGLFLLSFSITFSRFQFDCLHKRDRFGGGIEKYLRFGYLWSAKIIWLVTLAILIVTARLMYQSHEIEAAAFAIAGLTAIHEIPLWICLLPQCGKLAAKATTLFFLIPQFTSLISLIYWVNMDPQIYTTNIGSIVLGVYFWAEVVLLCGWLADANADKDIDLVPLYPHLFGDLISSCFSSEDYSSIP